MDGFLFCPPPPITTPTKGMEDSPQRCGFNPPVCPSQAARGEPARTAAEAGGEAEEVFGEIAR